MYLKIKINNYVPLHFVARCPLLVRYLYLAKNKTLSYLIKHIGGH